MESFAPSIANYLNIWWGIPSVLWILAATEGVKRLKVVPCRFGWVVSLAIGILGAVLWTMFGPPPRVAYPGPTAGCDPGPARTLANEIAYGVRGAFLAAGLFAAASHTLDEIRGIKRNGSSDTDRP